jgi:hypothetical protein
VQTIPGSLRREKPIQNPLKLSMPDNKTPTPATDAVKALAWFLYDPEIENEPREQIQAELKNAGIDTKAVMKAASEMVSQAKSRQRLITARERRQRLLMKVAELKAVATYGAAQLRARVKEVLDAEFAGKQEAAVLFRKFQEASDEDLQTLLDDILLLGEANDEERRSSS